VRSRRGASKQPAPPRPPQPIHVVVIRPAIEDQTVAVGTPSGAADPEDVERPSEARRSVPGNPSLAIPDPEEEQAEQSVGAGLIDLGADAPAESPTSMSGQPEIEKDAGTTQVLMTTTPLAEVLVGGEAGVPAGIDLSAPTDVPIAPAPAPAPAPEPARVRGRFRRNQKRPQHRRTHPRRRMVLAVRVVVIALLAASASIVAVRLHIRPPLAVVRSTLLTSRSVPGVPPVIPWPAGVESAIAIPALGVNEQSGPQIAVPIASVTKLMTAHIVLMDHPISVGEDGPSITITPNDVELYEEDVASDQANIQVAVGEVLTEHQLLEGMLVHSASNFADLLAIWDAGSISAFVAKMNAATKSLGMTQTQYADASGYLAQSVSTAADQLKVAAQDVANPVFDQIVDTPTITLPVGGTAGSYTPLIGVDGVVGVKSGFTSAAGGCDILALKEDVHGVAVEVLAAVVGNHVGTDVITEAGFEALAIAQPAMSAIQGIDLASRGERVGLASASGHTVPIVTSVPIAVLAWPGQSIYESFHVARHPRAGAARGFRIGSIHVQVGPQKFQVVVRTAKALPSPTFFQRVF
jgi:serine-type D-Ala-D-Ala carboxypeptidase (penicillin-binding protein 5/6)